MSYSIKNFLGKMTHTSRGCNFLGSNPFLPIFSVIDAQRGGLHLFFGHHKQLFQLASYVSIFHLACSTLKENKSLVCKKSCQLKVGKKKCLEKM